MKLLNKILDFIFPPKCMWCWAYWLFICSQCFLSFKKRKINFVIWNNVIKIFSPFKYSENKLLKKIIKDVKYNFHFWETLNLISPISNIIFDEFRYKEIVLIPVPLHWKRKLWRWFNQAELLANLIKNDCINKLFIEQNKIRVISLLKRIKNTKPQACLSRIDRLTNLDSAFCVCKKDLKINDSSIFIIVDDISTTWETIERCALEIKNQFNNDIYWLVIATDRY